MIAVIGDPILRLAEAGGVADGLAVEIARAARADGAAVEVIGKLGDDPDGDAVLLSLAASGIGHVAMLREGTRTTPRITAPADADPTVDDATPAGIEPADPARRPILDGADLDLALRYLTELGVVVVTDPRPELAAVAAAAAGWHGARLVVLLPDDVTAPPDLPNDAITLGVPAWAPDGAAGPLVGRFAARLDRGEAPDAALRAATADGGWTAAAASGEGSG